MTQQFIDAIREHGLNPPAQIPPGEFIRFPGKDKKNGNKAGWARLFPDCLGGVFGDYSTGLNETWQSEKAKTYTASQRINFDNMIKEQQAKAQALKDNEQKEAATLARETWETLQPADNNHPYLLAKKIKSYDLRVMGDLLVMPVYSPDNEITTYQTIAPDGSKRLHKGGKKQGCAFIIHGHGDRLYIVEGYATGASVHEATGSTVLVAIDAGNLLPVVESISRDKHKNIIIAADNDHGKGRNTGIDAAKAINAKYNEIEYVAPPAIHGRMATDWNDYVNEKGIDKAREILIHREEVLTSDDIQTDNLTLHIPQKYYENPLIELGLKASAEISALSILQYALPSVVAHIATALAGKIRYKSVHPSFFFIRIGPTSTGKTFVDKSFKDLLYSKFDSIQPRRDNKPPDVVNTFYGPTDIASGPGFARAIQNHPRCLMIVDEGTYLISSGTQSGGKRSENTQSKVKYILELSTGAGGIAEIAHSDSEKDKSIRGAVVNLIGNGTKIMLNELSVADIENGLIQRLDFWAYDGMEPYWNMDAGETDEYASDFAERLKELHSLEKPEGCYDLTKQDAVDIGAMPEAKDFLKSLSRELTDAKNAEHDDGIKGIIGRRFDNTIKWSLLFHGAKGPDHIFTPLTLDELKQGYNMSKLLADWKIVTLVQNISSGEFHARCDMFIDAIKKCLKARKKATRKSMETRRAGLKNLAPQDWDAVVSTLKLKRQIRMIEGDGKQTHYELLKDGH